MAEQFDHLKDNLVRFIEAQKMFFVATAPAGGDGRINLSPKGMDSLRVLSPTRVAWLSVTGSGNETAAHVADNGRMTIMFCSFEAQPLILRLYGKARCVYQNDPDWGDLFAGFTPLPGARQIFDLEIDMVQTSCGYAIPFYDYQGERDTLIKWAENKGDEGLRAAWEEGNQESIDGLPTFIKEGNLAD